MQSGAARQRNAIEPRLGIEVERRGRAADLAEAGLQLGARERERRGARDVHRVALAPSLRDAPHVRHDPYRADDRRRVDGAPVRLVVERDVARHDRHPERAARRGHALDRLRELPGDLGLLRVAEVEAVREADRLASGAGDVARRLENRERAAEPRIEPRDPPLPVEAQREASHRRPEAQHRCVEAGPAHGPRADELVVAPVDERAAPDVRGGEKPEERVAYCGRLRDLGGRGRSARLEQKVVARALLGQEAGRDLADGLVVPERAELAGVRHLADHGVMELPAVEHRLDGLEHRPADDRDHPLLALGDHDLPGLHLLLAERNPVEVDVDSVVGRHLRERRRDARGAAVLERLDEARARRARPTPRSASCP